MPRIVQNDQNKCTTMIADIDQMIMHHITHQAYRLNFVIIGYDTRNLFGRLIPSVTNVLPTVGNHGHT